MTTDQTRLELNEEIQETREQLGETVAELTHRLDVKARAKEKVRSVPPPAYAAVGGVALLGAGLLIWRRRH